MAVEAAMLYNMNPPPTHHHHHHHHQEYPLARDLYPNYNNNFSKQEVVDTQTPYSSANINHHFDDIHQPHVAADWNHIWCSSLPQLDLDILSNIDHTIPIVSSSSLNKDEQLNLDISNSNSNSNRTPKRRRGKARKNKEEMESQRMTHIAVERNRRKQMNHYLSLLRSLMPPSYVQRGDQASIIGGAINFVKELEQRLQFLGAHNHEKKCEKQQGCTEIPTMPFSDFFSFPQYSSMGDQKNMEVDNNNNNNALVGDIEVTMVESHANVKIRSKKRPKQLLNIVSALHSMHLTILHLNLTTTSDFVLYSISLKLEEECKLGSVDEIAAALHQMLQRIQHHSSSPMLNDIQHPNFN